MPDYEYPLKDYLNSINLKTVDMTFDERAMKKYPYLMKRIDSLEKEIKKLKK